MKIPVISVCMTLCLSLSVGNALGQQAIPAVASSKLAAPPPPAAPARSAAPSGAVVHVPHMEMIAQASFEAGVSAKVKGGPPSQVSKRVQLQNVDGVMTLIFPAVHYCRPENCNVEGPSTPGRLSITEKTVAFAPYDKPAEMTSQVPGTTMKDAHTKKGDTYSLIIDKGEHECFGNEGYDSAFLTFMRLALTDFPSAVKQLQDSAIQ